MTDFAKLLSTDIFSAYDRLSSMNGDQLFYEIKEAFDSNPMDYHTAFFVLSHIQQRFLELEKKTK